MQTRGGLLAVVPSRASRVQHGVAPGLRRELLAAPVPARRAVPRVGVFCVEGALARRTERGVALFPRASGQALRDRLERPHANLRAVRGRRASPPRRRGRRGIAAVHPPRASPQTSRARRRF